MAEVEDRGRKRKDNVLICQRLEAAGRKKELMVSCQESLASLW